MSKAGKASDGMVGGLGRKHPSPDTIPHLQQQNSNGGAPGEQQRGSISGAPGGGPALTPTVSHGQSGSPVKESALQRGMSVDEQEEEAKKGVDAAADGEEPKGVPIRQ